MPKQRSHRHSEIAPFSLGRKNVTTLVSGVFGFAVLLAGCASIPADVDGTLQRVRDGELRVGITHNPPWTNTAADADPTGREVRLLQSFAESLNSTIVWTEGSESVLTDKLHGDTLDLVIGGFTDDTPWTDKAAITVPFDEEVVDGAAKKHVMMTVLGENDFLTTLEAFLIERGNR